VSADSQMCVQALLLYATKGVEIVQPTGCHGLHPSTAVRRISALAAVARSRKIDHHPPKRGCCCRAAP
jgi:hypothetical protein